MSDLIFMNLLGAGNSVRSFQSCVYTFKALSMMMKWLLFMRNSFLDVQIFEKTQLLHYKRQQNMEQIL